MLINVLKSKIHRATVKQAELNYVGSITIDQSLMEASGIYEYEKVQIVDVDNGNRFETYGLARSSRNTYLSQEGRQAALVLSRSIFMGKKMIEDGERNPEAIKKAMRELIGREPMARTDYVEIVNAATMKSVDVIEGDILCAIAVYIGDEARLIDNFMITV